MAVLTLKGKAINWAKPPKPNARVKWSKPDMYGRAVTGSLFAIAHLDQLDEQAQRKFKSSIVVIQPPHNTGVEQSKGTHDLDFCMDLYIPGVPWERQQAFLRARGFACWYRRPPTFSAHIHGFSLPPKEGFDPNDDFRVGGFRVGKYVDGGVSLYGRKVYSSQIEDYYNRRTGLAGHYHDPSWFPKDLGGTVFNLDAYIAKRTPKPPKTIGLTWNAKVGRSTTKVEKALTKMLKRNRLPRVVALQEVAGYRHVIRRVAKALGYVVYQPEHEGTAIKGVLRESGTCALLVHKSVPVRNSGEIRCSQRWTGPKGRVHEGRVIPWVVAEIDGRWTLAFAGHMPTGRGVGNRKAREETINRIQRLIETRPKNVAVLGMADWNWGWGSQASGSPRTLAKTVGGYVAAVKGAPVDYAIVRGHRISASKGSRYGSDHHLIRFKRK